MADTNYQNLFCASQHGRYFLTHSIGLMPVSTPAALERSYLDQWRTGADDIWPQWLAGIAEFNQALAQLLNSNAAQFCPQANVSSGLSKVIMSLPKKAGKTVIVATESDFPSAGFVLKQAERLGYTLKLIPKSDDPQALAKLSTWEQALTPDVHTAFITQVHYNTNLLTPVEEIAEICRARNIVSIVDTAQATGIVPIDLSHSNIDIAVGSCIKWLCGGPGAGFVWFNQDVAQQLEPYDVGWFSHQNPFEFDIHHFAYADDAARFWGGTPSVASYIVATNSIRLMIEIGIPTLQAHNRALTLKLLNALPEESIVSPTDVNKKGGTVVLKFRDQEAVTQSLRNNHVLFDAREYGLRLSPHIYTNEQDIEHVIDCLHSHF